jgi:hypothetical protein
VRSPLALSASDLGRPTELPRERAVLDADLAAEAGARVDDRGEILRGADDAVHRGAADRICRRGGGTVRRRAGHRAVAEDDARARGENAELRRSTARVTAGEPPAVRHLGTVREAAVVMAVAGDEAGGGARRHQRQNPQNPDESPRDPHAAMVAPCSPRTRARGASRVVDVRTGPLGWLSSGYPRGPVERNAQSGDLPRFFGPSRR